MNLGFKQKFADGRATHFIAKIWNGFVKSDDYNFFLEWNWDNEIIITNLDDKFLSADAKPKLHTIREDNANRWTAGTLIHFIINNRTPDRLQFAPVIPVVRTQKISIYPNWSGVTVQIDGLYKSLEEIKILAINDGFDSVEDFYAYFNRNFTGKIIHWTNLKY
jgi:hypothetical protein